MLEVPSLKILRKLPNSPEEGELAYCEFEKQTFVFNKNEWKPVTNSFSMSYYDLNKAIIDQYPNLETFNEKISLINEYNLYNKSKMYLLYGRDLNYFSLFTSLLKKDSSITFGEEVINCLKNISSNIKAIDWNKENNSIEIWLTVENVSHCLYLFNADEMVISIGE